MHTDFGGCDSTDLAAAGRLPPQAVRLRLRVRDERDLARVVFRSDVATLRLLELDLLNPGRVCRTCTVGTLLEEVREGVALGLKLGGLAGTPRGVFVLRQLGEYAALREEFELELDCAAGMSWIEGVDGHCYDRTWDQKEELGLLAWREEQGREVEDLERLIAGARSICVLTGAGVSAESGITPFRSGPSDSSSSDSDSDCEAEEDGEEEEKKASMWNRYSPTDLVLQRIRDEPEVRRQHWAMEAEMMDCAAAAEPNACHLYLTKLFESGRLHTLITQNIDRLHTRAGVPLSHVVELHGQLFGTRCIDCGDEREDAEEARAAAAHPEGDPRCRACDGPLKAATRAFGESLVPEELRRAREAVQQCDLLLLMGSSMLVAPANLLPAEALRRDVPVAIVNLGPTRYDPFAHVRVQAKCAETLAQLGTPGEVDELSGAVSWGA